jgi:hypothetical protein
MDAQDFRSLQEAYLDVYQINEDWKPVNVPRVKSRMGDLEQRIPANRGPDSPEYTRYQRTADVVAQSTRNPNKPFQKPTFDPGGLRAKPGGGATFSPERNSQWQPFSSKLPTKTPAPAKATKPSGGARGGGSSPGSVKPSAKPSTPSSSTPKLRSIPGSSAPRPGRGSTSNWMTDRMGEFTSALTRVSKPNSTAKPPAAKPLTRRGGGGGGSSGSSGVKPIGYGESPIVTQSRDKAQRLFDRDRRGGMGSMLANSYEPDLYDIILLHLLDEGYAETPEAAEVIMANMSEEWRDSIIG